MTKHDQSFLIESTNNQRPAHGYSSSHTGADDSAQGYANGSPHGVTLSDTASIFQ